MTARDCTYHLIRHQTVLNLVTDKNLCSFYSTGRAFGRQIRAHLLRQPAVPYLDCLPTRIAPQWTTIDVQGTSSFKRSSVTANIVTLHINQWPAVHLRSVHMFLADFLFHLQKPKVIVLAFFTEHKRCRVWSSYVFVKDVLSVPKELMDVCWLKLLGQFGLSSMLLRDKVRCTECRTWTGMS